MSEPSHSVHTITCILVEEHSEVRNALARVLPGEGIDIVAHARTGADAVEIVAGHAADLVLVDLTLPDTNGIDLARSLIALVAEVRIVLYTADLTTEGARLAIEAGIRGIVLKESAVRALVSAIRVVASGGIYLDPRLDPQH
jgi:DNA-binding NarL/FixJ family response regulator